MRKIIENLDKMGYELEYAKEYAETYLEYKAEGKHITAKKYKDMANDELKHAAIIRDIAIDDYKQLKAAYTPPAEMKQIWEKENAAYVDKAAWIKTMLNL